MFKFFAPKPPTLVPRPYEGTAHCKLKSIPSHHFHVCLCRRWAIASCPSPEIALARWMELHMGVEETQNG